jgi:hypothetical protein
MERIVLPSGRILEYDETDPAYLEDFLKVAGGYAEEARRIEEAGDWSDAANWWRCAGALYAEAGRVCPDAVTKEGHFAAATECERRASALSLS